MWVVVVESTGNSTNAYGPFRSLDLADMFAKKFDAELATTLPLLPASITQSLRPDQSVLGDFIDPEIF